MSDVEVHLVTAPLCSPLRRCFPPQPTICWLCKRTEGDGQPCPLGLGPTTKGAVR